MMMTSEYPIYIGRSPYPEDLQKFMTEWRTSLRCVDSLRRKEPEWLFRVWENVFWSWGVPEGPTTFYRGEFDAGFWEDIIDAQFVFVEADDTTPGDLPDRRYVTAETWKQVEGQLDEYTFSAGRYPLAVLDLYQEGARLVIKRSAPDHVTYVEVLNWLLAQAEMREPTTVVGVLAEFFSRTPASIGRPIFDGLIERLPEYASKDVSEDVVYKITPEMANKLEEVLRPLFREAQKGWYGE